MLAAGLGHEMPAVLAVVAAVFGGMSLGAWVSDACLGKSTRPERLYGWIELLIGVWGLFSVWLVPAINSSALRLTGLDASPAWQWLIAFILPGLGLLPATIGLGASFPAMERLLAQGTERRCVGALYASNTAGGVLGVVASAFLLVPQLGFSRAVGLFALTNVFCGAGGLVVAARYFESGTSGAVCKKPRPARSWRFVITLFATGLLGIGYEVLGIRVLGEVLENTIYSFAAVLSVFLIGTATGAAIYQVRSRQLEFNSTGLLIGLSVACLMGVWVLGHSAGIYQALRDRFGDGPLETACAECAIAALIFLWPTLWMGALFSHLVQVCHHERLGMGHALAWNTLGCALAPALFGVVLLPLLGSKWSFVALALGYLCLLRRLPQRQWLWLTLPLALILLLPRSIRFVEAPAKGKLLSYREGVMDSVAVVEHFDGNRSLLVNNRFMMGGTGASSAERRHAHIPLLLHPNPREALFLGLGTGISFAASGAEPQLQADGVELVPEIVQALPWFEPFNALPSPPGRLKVFTADARRFVRSTPKRYDVIVADLFHPAREGAGALYALEHFRAIRSRLTKNGIFCQWLPLFQMDEAVLQVIVHTFLAVFPESRAFLLRLNVDTPVIGLVGYSGTIRYAPDYFEQRVAQPGLREQLQADQLRDRFQFFGNFLAGPAALARYARNAPINTDDRPIIVFMAPHFAARRNAPPHGRLPALLGLDHAELPELFQGHNDPAFLKDLAAYVSARNTYLAGLIAESEGNQVTAIDHYIESARESAQFSAGYAHCLTIAAREANLNPAAAREILRRLVEARPDRPVAAQLLQRLPGTR